MRRHISERKSIAANIRTVAIRRETDAAKIHGRSTVLRDVVHRRNDVAQTGDFFDRFGCG